MTKFYLTGCARRNVDGVFEYYSADTELYRIDLENPDTLITASGLKVSDRADILRGEVAVSRSPKIKLSLSSAIGAIKDLLVNQDIGHRLEIETDDGDTLFAGTATRTQRKSGGMFDVEFEDEVVQFHGLRINKRPDKVPAFESAANIFNELAQAGWQTLQQFDFSGFSLVTRPTKDVVAGKFINNLLIAENHLIVRDGLEQKIIENAPRVDIPQVSLIGDRILSTIVEVDFRDRMRNVINYEYVDGLGEDIEGQYLGEIDRTRPPETYRIQYGNRIAEFDFKHLSASDAEAAATRLLTDRLYSRLRRFKLKTSAAVQLLQRLRVDVYNWDNANGLLAGFFYVTAITVDVLNQVSVIEITEATAAQLELFDG